MKEPNTGIFRSATKKRRAESQAEARFEGAKYHRTWQSVFHASASALKSART